MPRNVLIIAGCLATASSAWAAPSDRCPSLADGRWVVVAIRHREPIVALGEDEAKAYIGKEITISGDRVAFDGRSCQGAKRKVHDSFGEQFSTPGFPYDVTYVCPGNDDTVVPVISLGKSCDEAIFGRDGVTFTLRKKR